jgi:hypothetical protein
MNPNQPFSDYWFLANKPIFVPFSDKSTLFLRTAFQAGRGFFPVRCFPPEKSPLSRISPYFTGFAAAPRCKTAVVAPSGTT